MNIYILVYHEANYSPLEFEIVGAFTDRRQAIETLANGNTSESLEVVKDGVPQDFEREVITYWQAREELEKMED